MTKPPPLAGPGPITGRMVHVPLDRCWAKQGHLNCRKPVPADPNHVGLCDDCIERLRELEGARP